METQKVYVPIERLKELSKQYHLSHLILFAYHPESKEHHIVTYGQTQEGCGQAADFGNQLKDALGWPESLHKQPSRVRRLQNRIKLLETYSGFVKSCIKSGEIPESFEEFEARQNDG